MRAPEFWKLPPNAKATIRVDVGFELISIRTRASFTGVWGWYKASLELAWHSHQISHESLGKGSQGNPIRPIQDY